MGWGFELPRPFICLVLATQTVSFLPVQSVEQIECVENV